MLRNSLNRDSNFDRDFSRMRTLFWVFFGVVATLVVAVWATVGFGIYTLLTDPESIGNIAAEAIRPVADVIRGE